MAFIPAKLEICAKGKEIQYHFKSGTNFWKWGWEDQQQEDGWQGGHITRLAYYYKRWSLVIESMKWNEKMDHI